MALSAWEATDIARYFVKNEYKLSQEQIERIIRKGSDKDINVLLNGLHQQGWRDACSTISNRF